MTPYQICQKVWNPLGYHVHHIVPVSLGGSDDWDNLSPLLREDHDALHSELAAENPENRKLMYASMLMKCTPDTVAAGHLGGKVSGPRAAINGSGFNTFEHRSRGGKSRVAKHGNPATQEGSRKGGKVTGQMNARNGHLERIKTLETLAKGGSVAGKLLWWNDGIVNIRSMSSPGESFKKGRIPWKQKTL